LFPASDGYELLPLAYSKEINMAPTTYDADRADEQERIEKRRNAFFKVLIPVLWVILTIIVIGLLMTFLALFGYFS
jgi:uncharacterized membrane protein YdbT with pleckstrin-like domain